MSEGRVPDEVLFPGWPAPPPRRASRRTVAALLLHCCDAPTPQLLGRSAPVVVCGHCGWVLVRFYAPEDTITVTFGETPA